MDVIMLFGSEDSFTFSVLVCVSLLLFSPLALLHWVERQYDDEKQ